MVLQAVVANSAYVVVLVVRSHANLVVVRVDLVCHLVVGVVSRPLLVQDDVAAIVHDSGGGTRDHQ